MEVQSITKYKFKGKEYNSLKEIQDVLHNIIGEEVLDKISRTCPLQKHADYLKLLNLLCSKEIRTVLMKCFTVNVEQELPYYEQGSLHGDTETINILDI
jgi:hypothetical protein